MTQPGEAQTIAEQLRQEVAAIPWRATERRRCEHQTDQGPTQTNAVIEHLVDAADTAMYEAKRAGGNQSRQAESTEIAAPGQPH